MSLQQISKLQDQTQLRLATGLKVNSAIDNPSSYYTAQSLANRAADLSSLLDAMGQGIQTIKAASEGIEAAQTMVEQMKSIAERVIVDSKVPEKEYFVGKVGANGAVVSNTEELRSAIQSGKETICVYGKIDLEDISTTGGITLTENQKLVGVNYFGNFSNGEGFSEISCTSNYANKSLITINKAGCLISDLSIDYQNDVVGGGNTYAMYVSGTTTSVELHNLDITMKINENNTSEKFSVYNSGASLNISGKLVIKTSGNFAQGLMAYRGTVTFMSDSLVNISTISNGLRVGGTASVVNIAPKAQVNIVTSSHGIWSASGAQVNISSGAYVNIITSGNSSRGIFADHNASINVGGNVQVVNMGRNALGIFSWGTTNILSTANIHLSSDILVKSSASGQITIASQAKIGIEDNGQKKWYEVQSEEIISGENTVTADNITTKLSLSETGAWETAGEIIDAKNKEEEENKDYNLTMTDELSSYQQQYNDALSQYDKLISDSFYKGINLLKGESLKINFNEDRSSNVVVQGEDLSSNQIGLEKAEWTTTKSLQNSLTQVLNATSMLRENANTLGNYYSIITTREDFTSNLINVLEEGADKLTLADMNEESANMLALQTRQNLAINSLSLASQSEQGILKLF